MNTKHLIITIIAVIMGVYFVMTFWPKRVEAPINEVVCTREAKSCPDGSFVGRMGPKCEFADCPGENDMGRRSMDTSEWKTYRNEKYGFELRYPKEWIYEALTPDKAIDENTYFSNDPQHQECFGCAGIQLEMSFEKNSVPYHGEIIKKDKFIINGIVFSHIVDVAIHGKYLYMVEKNGVFIFFNFGDPVVIGHSTDESSDNLSLVNFFSTFKFIR